MAAPSRRIFNPVLFICDLQEKFRPAIYEYEAVIDTAQKMLKAAKILKIPILATTQQSAKLGPTCAELSLDTGANSLYKSAAHVDKTKFSMMTPEILKALETINPSFTSLTCIIVGIETHICVTQTTLDLLGMGHKVYVLADGVSSCNKEEIGIALNRLRGEGAVVTTSESFIYECMGDAGIEEFREIAALVKEWKTKTQGSLRVLGKI